ncbi:single-stranded DNA-binding protein [Deinococcus xinjiangensis]|uniref:Single-stranded DNA-binding protein n=1 Tax=Deinococcus xinjiangensis TaxID=457454 RepID=A0ABP9VCN3_9DEIO
MTGLNTHFLIGTLVRDPELRYTPSGMAVFEFTLAGEREVLGKDGHPHAIPFYARSFVMGKYAETLAERQYKQGQAFMMDGSLDYSQWQTPEGGKRSMVRTKLTGLLRELGYQYEAVSDTGGGLRMKGGCSKIRLVGNVVRDPELRYTPAGDAVMDLGIAVNETWKDAQGQKQEKTHWIEATLWRELAERHQELRKGDPVLLEGALINEAWTDKDGNRRSSTKVEVTSLELLARLPQQAAAPSAKAAPAPARQAAPARSSAPRPAAARGQPAGQSTKAAAGGMSLDDFPPEEEDLPF